MNDKNDSEKRDKDPTKAFIAVSAAVCFLVVGYAAALIYFTWPIDELSLGKSGVFGDSFGALTSLFSGLAFGGLIVAIMLQRADLQLQQTELRLTRKEIKSQNFENTLFQMLRLHNEIVGAMRSDFYESWNVEDGQESRTTPVSGRDCFLEFRRRFESRLDDHPSYGDDPGALTTIQRAYNEFWKINQQALGHYFRYLYRIFRFIDHSDAQDKDKLLYSGIVRAQLSDLELLLLYYNCLSRFGIKKFKPLAEHYALFDNLPIDMVIHDDHLSLYDLRAWGAQAEAVKQRLEKFAARDAARTQKASP